MRYLRGYVFGIFDDQLRCRRQLIGPSGSAEPFSRVIDGAGHDVLTLAVDQTTNNITLLVGGVAVGEMSRTARWVHIGAQADEVKIRSRFQWFGYRYAFQSELPLFEPFLSAAIVAALCRYLEPKNSGG
jgi:hypothetical protein